MPITRKEALLNSISGGESANLSPITREEQYLAYIAGESNSYPINPITRGEVYLDKIAKSGISGGGTGINVQPITITENGTYTAPEGVAYSPLHVSVKSSGGGGTEPTPSGENKLVKVVSDTEEYEITASDLEGATAIKKYAFYYSTKLKSIEIPNSVTEIGVSAFFKSENLTNITILGNSLSKVDSGVFEQCKNLTSINIPNSVTTIGSDIFKQCLNLAQVTLSNGLTTIPQNGFFGCTKLETIIIPDKVSSIMHNAFNGCTSLKTVTFGNGIKTIGYASFYNCTAMEYMDFTKCESIPTLDSLGIYGIPSTCEIRVPMALVDEWKAATNWSNFASQIVGAIR